MARSSREEIRLEITTFCTGVIEISFFAARTGIMRQAPCPNSAATPAVTRKDEELIRKLKCSIK